MQKGFKPLAEPRWLTWLNRAIGFFFLVWTIPAGGGLLRWILLGTENDLWHEIAGYVLGLGVAVLFWHLWYLISQKNRADVVSELWRLFLLWASLTAAYFLFGI